MSTKIRLHRAGSKKAPFYRIIVADSRAPRDGKNIEELGFYNPITKNNDYKIKINKEKAIYWINTGAIVSETVKKIFKKIGINNNNKKK